MKVCTPSNAWWFLSECTDLETVSTEVVNGYHLIDSCSNICDFATFKQILGILKKGKKKPAMTWQEWQHRFNPCSDWNRMDVNGDLYKGYYSYPEGSHEKQHAWMLTFDTNRRALFDLPFPKQALLRILKIACASRAESVKHINFFCVWIQRKAERMTYARQVHAHVIQHVKGILAQPLIVMLLEYLFGLMSDSIKKPVVLPFASIPCVTDWITDTANCPWI